MSDTSSAAGPVTAGPGRPVAPGLPRWLRRSAAGLPPTSFFAVSAIFHYLGPSLAVLLFAHIEVLGVAWLRIAAAAAVFACWRRPWRLIKDMTWSQRRILIGLGAVLAVMNTFFYLAVDRIPLATVGAIEFLGIIVLAAAGARTKRNAAALALAVAGVAALTNARIAGEPLGFVFAFANCAGFILYVILGHRIANAAADEGAERQVASGIDQLGAAMLVAAVVVIRSESLTLLRPCCIRSGCCGASAWACARR